MRAGVLAAALLLAGCATPRLMSYGVELADARFVLPNGHAFSVYVHPSDPMLLVQARLSQTNQSMRWTLQDWRDGAEAIAKPAGCGVSEMHKIATGSFEASYVCPPGVDLRGMVMAQRTALQAGEPLHR